MNVFNVKHLMGTSFRIVSTNMTTVNRLKDRHKNHSMNTGENTRFPIKTVHLERYGSDTLIIVVHQLWCLFPPIQLIQSLQLEIVDLLSYAKSFLYKFFLLLFITTFALIFKKNLKYVLVCG